MQIKGVFLLNKIPDLGIFVFDENCIFLKPEANSASEIFYFLDDYHQLWKEGNTKIDDAAVNAKYTINASMLNQIADLNGHFVTIFNTKRQQILFLSDNPHKVLGPSITKEYYEKNPVLFWLKSTPLKQSWFLMQLSLFYQSKVQNRLKNAGKNATVRWYFHNFNLVKHGIRIGIHGKALEVLPNGTMLIMMSVMKDITSFVKENSPLWAEVCINEADYFYFLEANNKFLTGRLLSDRELEILSLIKAGFDTKEIAEKLFISTATIDTHRKNILTKTGAKDISNAIQILTFAEIKIA